MVANETRTESNTKVESTEDAAVVSETGRKYDSWQTWEETHEWGRRPWWTRNMKDGYRAFDPLRIPLGSTARVENRYLPVFKASHSNPMPATPDRAMQKSCTMTITSSSSDRQSKSSLLRHHHSPLASSGTRSGSSLWSLLLLRGSPGASSPPLG